MQYHWFNRSYTSFDDFLSAFESRKRKTVRKARQAIDRFIDAEHEQINAHITYLNTLLPFRSEPL